MAEEKLTKRSVHAAKPPKDPERWSWIGDVEIPGFGVKVYGTGKKVFALRYRTLSGRQRMYTLGTYGALTVEKARDLARDAYGKVKKGGDPQGEKQSARSQDGPRTVGDLVSLWLEKYAKKNRRGWKEDERRYKNRIKPKVGSVPLSDFTEERLRKWHQNMGRRGKVEANRVVEIVRAAWRWGEAKKMLPPGLDDPTRGYGAGKHGFKNKERSRTRYLRMEEAKRLMAEVRKEEDPYVRAAIPLLLLTGLRRSELFSAKWENVDLDHGEILLPETKSGEEQTRTLTDAAVKILRELPRMDESPYVFPSPADPSKPRWNIQKPWRRIRKAAGLEDVTLHDLRRTCGSYLAQSGVPVDHIASILGHQDKKVTEIYTELSENEKRNALEALATKLAPVLGTAKEPEKPQGLPDRLRALLEAAEDDPDALVEGLRGLVDWDKAVEA